MILRKALGYSALIIVFLLIQLPAFAQCSMCKVSAEASLKEGDNIALGLNSGILYLASFPYILALVLGFLYYRHHQKMKEAKAASEI